MSGEPVINPVMTSMVPAPTPEFMLRKPNPVTSFLDLPDFVQCAAAPALTGLEAAGLSLACFREAAQLIFFGIWRDSERES